MNGLVEVGLGNALMATFLALVVGVIGLLIRRRPALVHGLWLIVLLRLLAPPIWFVPVGTLALPRTIPLSDGEPVPMPPPITPATRPTSDLTRGDIATHVGASLDVFEALNVPTATSDVSPTSVAAIPGDRHLQQTSAMPPISVGDPAEPVRTAFRWPGRRAIPACAWLTGTVIWLGCVAVRVRRFRRGLRCAVPAPASAQAQVDALAGRLGLAWSPGVWIVPGSVAPLVWGLGRSARLVVPGSLWDRLDTDQRDALILHELAHIKRGDPWIRLIELAATGLYWWHPVVWWARRAMREAEEQCCDAWVVWASGPGSGRAYATALVEAIEFLSEARPALPPAASGMSLSGVKHLSRRIVMIMKGTTPRTLSWFGLIGLATLAGLSLTWLPSWGQSARRSGTPTPAASAPLSPGDRSEIAILESQLAQKRAGLRKAEALHELARTKLARFERLNQVSSGSISVSELTEARLQVEIAGADLAQAQAEVQEYEIRLQATRQARGASARRATATPDRPMIAPGEPVIVDRVTLAPADPKDNRAVNNLKQIGLAIHNYHDTHNRLPAPAIRDEQGQPLLSWRVALLPYLDRGELYNRFRLNEAWNSPHNLTLLGEMPDVYLSRDTGYPGLTFKSALVGPETAWGDNIKISDIRDGTSNTIAVVESAYPVPWTKPDDITIWPVGTGSNGGVVAPPVPPLGPPGATDTMALFLDGSVRTISKKLRPMVFQALVTRAGREVISADQLRTPDEDKAADLSGMMGMMMGGGPPDPGMMGGPSQDTKVAPGAMMSRGDMGSMMRGGGMEAMMGYGGMMGGEGDSMMAGMMGGRGMAAPSSSDRDRLDALEQKLDRILQEMETLRRGRGSDALPIEGEPTLMPAPSQPRRDPFSIEPVPARPPQSPFELMPPPTRSRRGDPSLPTPSGPPPTAEFDLPLPPTQPRPEIRSTPPPDHSPSADDLAPPRVEEASRSSDQPRADVAPPTSPGPTLDHAPATSPDDLEPVPISADDPPKPPDEPPAAQEDVEPVSPPVS